MKQLYMFGGTTVDGPSLWCHTFLPLFIHGRFKTLNGSIWEMRIMPHNLTWDGRWIIPQGHGAWRLLISANSLKVHLHSHSQLCCAWRFWSYKEHRKLTWMPLTPSSAKVQNIHKTCQVPICSSETYRSRSLLSLWVGGFSRLCCSCSSPLANINLF